MKRVHQKELSSDEELDQYKFRYRKNGLCMLEKRTLIAFNRPVTPFGEHLDQAGASITPEFIGFPTAPPNTIHDPLGSWRTTQDSVITKTSPVESPSHPQIVEVLAVNKTGSESHPCVPNSSTIQGVHSENNDTSLDNQAGIPGMPSSPPSVPIGETECMEPRRLKDNASSSPTRDLDSKATHDVDYPNRYRTNALDDPQNRPSVLPFGNTQLSKPPEGLASMNDKAFALPEPGSFRLEDRDLLTDRIEVVKLLERLRNSGVLGEVLGELGYKKDDPLEPEVTKQEPASSVSEQSQPHVCTHCQKRFNRRCELK
ncbi:hypothetical protein F5Y04DRAFT_68078 [Hypomontagnella monticulosa]|nr:hypothetical protein F5Y04DRAFT_68078 [Hypomontagnella monticulosa]